MDWWRKLRNNPLARLGAVILISFYILVIGADFIAPYNPYSSQIDGSLMPPTAIHWQNGGLVIYPTSQGATDLETGDRQLIIDRDQPQPLRLFVKGDPYAFLELKLPLPTTFEEKTILPGIKGDRHLFGVVGDAARFNLIGTDEQGRDHFSRLLFGGRISLFIGLVGITISFPLGMLVGGIAGYFGGWTDAILMRFVEVLMTIPRIYLLVSLSAVFVARDISLTSSQKFLLIVCITSFVGWSGLARVIRGQVLSIKNQEFVQAAQATGGRSLYIIVRHILPQTSTYAVISATLAIPSFIIAESVLSLIGLGIQQPDPSWGNLLSLGTNASILVLQPWLVWSPAVLIIITVLAFNLLGDGLRDALDPKNLERSR